MYKKVLKYWYKGTGGGLGESSLFEGWSDEKLEKYNIISDEYDHTNIKTQPVILLNGYCGHRTPYLTIVHLRDKKYDYLLSSRYDPLYIGAGKAGIVANNDDTSPLYTLL